MEAYALAKLESIFRDYRPEPEDMPGLYAVRAKRIVDAIKRMHPFEEEFRLAVWKINGNLNVRLKGDRAFETLGDLFGGRWKTADDFVRASDDELDSERAIYRGTVRRRVFERLERTNRMVSSSPDVSGRGTAAASGGTNGETCPPVVPAPTVESVNGPLQTNVVLGLACPRCKSENTEYRLLQTSRGDEGSTARSLCNSCGHRWKFR